MRRRRARRRALDILYQADVTGRSPASVLEERKVLGERIGAFTEALVVGVGERLGELDELMGAYAEGWTVRRMTPIDRNILRLACYELLSENDVPVAVAINEAVEAAKELSTKDSGRFVNGILGRIAAERSNPRGMER